MGEHYDMTQSVSLDKYNEVLWELDEKDDKISELEEDIEYYKEKTNNLNNLIKELNRELKRKDAKDIKKITEC